MSNGAVHAGGVDEKLEFISGQIAEFVRRFPYRNVIGINLDANGNGQAPVFECREYTSFELHRVLLQSKLHGPANPYASVNGWIGLYRNMVDPLNLIDYVPAGEMMFPSNFVYERDGAEVIEANGVLWIGVNGGPANDLVLARIQGVHHPDWRVAQAVSETHAADRRVEA
jgi:hypothetical protein